MAGIPSKYAALTAVFIGIAFGIGIGNATAGLIIGLSASGLYSGVKSMLK